MKKGSESFFPKRGFNPEKRNGTRWGHFFYTNDALDENEKMRQTEKQRNDSIRTTSYKFKRTSEASSRSSATAAPLNSYAGSRRWDNSGRHADDAAKGGGHGGSVHHGGACECGGCDWGLPAHIQQ